MPNITNAQWEARINHLAHFLAKEAELLYAKTDIVRLTGMHHDTWEKFKKGSTTTLSITLES